MGNLHTKDRMLDLTGYFNLILTCRPLLFIAKFRNLDTLLKKTLNKLITSIVRQAHHGRNQHFAVRPELVEGLDQSFLSRPLKNYATQIVSQWPVNTRLRVAPVSNNKILIGSYSAKEMETLANAISNELGARMNFWIRIFRKSSEPHQSGKSYAITLKEALSKCRFEQEREMTVMQRFPD